MKVFLKLLSWVAMMPLFGWADEIRLDRLVEYGKESCAKILQETALPDLWNAFLQGQTNLYFNQEVALFSNLPCWRKAQRVLELGSGNGAYLSRLSEQFQDKSFLGVEICPAFVEHARAQFEREGLTFLEGDAEKEREDCANQFDVVFYRATLQHLKNPRLSLALAHRYLTEGGHVVIFDSYDSAKRSSSEMPLFEGALRQLNERMRTQERGNRSITIEILEELQNKNGSLRELYEVVHTNLDTQGNHLEPGIRFESAEDRGRCFNHSLLFLSIMKKGYGVGVDLSEAYSALHEYFEDENTWICPGIHLLILRKI